MCTFSNESKDKLGNSIIYIANYVKKLSKTKLLKLLYLMEEEMVTRYHTPFLGLPFEVWQAGPVLKDVFIDLSGRLFLLKDYIQVYNEGNCTYIDSIAQFCDDEFSDCEIKMMDSILRKYGLYSAKDLVKITHKENGLWYKTAKENDLLESFEKKECNNSDIRIDFTQLLSNSEAMDYQDSLAIHQTANILKRNVSGR